MSEQDFSNREITSMFEHITEQLKRIEAQTVKTNGRVTRLETWRTIIQATGAALATIAGIVWTGATFFFK